MEKLRLLLVLITVGAIVGPIAGILILYRNNLQELIIPPEVQEMVSETINVLTPSNPSNPSSNGANASNGNLELPQYVNSSYDPSARTVTAKFNFTNPFDFSLAINDVSADVRCHSHNFELGHASMSEPVDIPPRQTADITVVFFGTEIAQEHFQKEHVGQAIVNVDLVNIVVSVSGISIQIPETYNVDIPISP